MIEFEVFHFCSSNELVKLFLSHLCHEIFCRIFIHNLAPCCPSVYPVRSSKSITQSLSRTLSLSSAWRIATASLSLTQANTIYAAAKRAYSDVSPLPSWSCRITCSLMIHPVPKNAICASMMSRCGTWAGGSIPELPN